MPPITIGVSYTFTKHKIDALQAYLGKETDMNYGTRKLFKLSSRFPTRSNTNPEVEGLYYTSNGYIVPMEFRVYFFPRISAFSRRTKMHLNEMLLIGTEFFKIIVPLYQPPISW